MSPGRRVRRRLHVHISAHDDATCLAVTGDLDQRAAAALTTAVNKIMLTGRPGLTVDTTAVVYCDAAGLVALLDACDRLLPADGRLRLIGPGAAVDAFLEATGLRPAFDIAPSTPGEPHLP
ncbi:STAS domain-containing protein [Longispora sp. NPDC051575]|uniref:STAS domain-containing protein n=1 Tax=Longispora sp. NPDC051575 TaxID=3154943 RepID=UPI003417C0AF